MLKLKRQRKRSTLKDPESITELSMFKASIKDEVQTEHLQKAMANRTVRVFMTNPKRRLNIIRAHGRATLDLLGFEAHCDHIVQSSIRSSFIVIDEHR